MKRVCAGGIASAVRGEKCRAARRWEVFARPILADRCRSFDCSRVWPLDDGGIRKAELTSRRAAAQGKVPGQAGSRQARKQAAEADPQRAEDVSP